MSHVPDENLTSYRALRAIADGYRSLGALHSGIGEYAEANKAWAIEGRYRERMTQLRTEPKETK